MNILDLLLPREVAFFKLMNNQADNFHEACKEFRTLLKSLEKYDDKEIRKHIQKIKRFETKGDQIEADIIDKLDTTFLTPIDREDIHDIAASVDDGLDDINDISQKIKIYTIRKIPGNVLKFADIMVESSLELKHLIATLQTKRSGKNILIRIHNLEAEADVLFHESIAELFSSDNATDIIKFKDLYEHLEDTVDCIEKTAKIIRGVIVKRG